MTRRLLGCALALVLAISGCWDNIDIKDRAMVLGLSIDLAEDDRFVVCLEIPEPGGEAAADSGGGETGFVHVCGSGQTLSGCLASIQRRLPREIFLGQLRAIMLGEGLARRPDLVERVIDDLLRDPLIDRKALLTVARGSAQDVLRTPSPLEPVSAEFIAEAHNRVRYNVNHPRTELWQFFRAIHTPGWDPVAVAVIAGEDQLELAGVALVRDYELVGWLGPYETRGLLWLLGRGVGTTVAVKTPAGEAEVVVTAVRLMPRPPPGSDLVVRCELRVTADLLVRPRDWEHPSEQDYLAMERELAAVIEREARQAIGLMQAVGADASGIGRQIYYRRAELWSALDWARDFERTRVLIAVDASIRGRGALN